MLINELIKDWIFNYSLHDTVHMIIAYHYYSSNNYYKNIILTNHQIFDYFIKPHIRTLSYYYPNINQIEILNYINYIMYFLNFGSVSPSLFIKKNNIYGYTDCQKNEAQWQIVLPAIYRGDKEEFKKQINFNQIIDIEQAISSLYLMPYLRRC